MTTYNLNIVSAVLGAIDVTEALQHLYQSSSSKTPPKDNTWTFQVSRGTLAPNAPVPVSNRLPLVIVWTVGLSSAQTSTFQIVKPIPLEGDSCTINYSGDSLPPFTPPALNSTQIFVVSAYWYNQPVDQEIRVLLASSSSRDTAIPATIQTFGDPAIGVEKSLTVTYGYPLHNGTFEYNTVNAWERASISIRHGPAPPRLLIHAANFGGADFVNEFRNLITFNQTIKFVPSDWATLGWRDPWPQNPSKSMAILYQWDTQPLELALVSSTDRSPLILDPIVPVDPKRTAFFNQIDTRNAGETNIIAMTWGIMQGQTKIPPNLFAFVKTENYFSPTDVWFTFDGWQGIQKTGVIFYQYGISGPIRAVAARQNEPNGRLVDRDSDIGDPLPGKGLLRENLVPWGFPFQTSQRGRYLRLDSSNNSFVADGDLSQAIGINVTAAASGKPIAQTWIRWADHPMGQLTVTDSGQVVLTKDIRIAREVHYELPSSADARGILLSFPQPTMRESPLTLTLLPSKSESPSGPQVWAIPYGASFYKGGLVAYYDSVFTFGGDVTTYGKPSELDTLKSDAKIDPTLWNIFCVVKDCVWDLPSIFFLGGVTLSESTITNGFIDWWTDMAPDIRNKILTFLKGLALKVHMTSGIMDKIKLAASIVGKIHDVNQLWTLFKLILGKTLSPVDTIVMVVSFLKCLIKWSSGAEIFGLVIDVTVWAIRLTTDILALTGTIGSTTPITSIVTRLLRSSSKFKTMTYANRELVARALMEPHLSRLQAGGTVKPPVEHSHQALEKLRGSSTIPDDLALKEFQQADGLLVDPEARALVEGLRPKVETSLLEFGDSSPQQQDSCSEGHGKMLE